jgi:uncharacterized DUF497 family protein
MKPFRWNHDKNKLLQQERGVSFEEIVLAIEADGLLDTLPHPNAEMYPNQSIFVVEYQNYAYIVPFIEEFDYYFLKTAIPNRKATKQYLNRSTHHEST